MNKEFARAWDDIETLSAEHGGHLQRDGHRLNYTWTSPARPDQEPVECLAWAEENVPRYCIRVGDIAGRFWNLDAARKVLSLLLADHAEVQISAGGQAGLT